MFRQSSVRTIPAQTRFTLTGASSIASARVTASRAPQIPAAMTHPFRGRKPMIPLVRMIDPVVLIRLAAYFAAPTAPQKRVSKIGGLFPNPQSQTHPDPMIRRP